MATRALTTDVPSGTTLQFVNYTVTGYPTPAVAFQWKRDGVAIAGATDSKYQLTDLDVGTEITVEVSVTNIFSTRRKIGGMTGGFGVTSGPSTPSIAPSFLGTPSASVFGTTVGQVVEILNRGVTGFPEPSVSYDWYLNESIISGANGYTYAPEEVGELTASIIATNTVGTTSADINFGTVVSESQTDLSGFTVDLSGTSGGVSDIYIEGTAYANVSGISLDESDGITLSYLWYREIPSLIGITVS